MSFWLQRYEMPEGPMEYLIAGINFGLEMLAIEIGFFGVYVAAIGGCYLTYRIIRGLFK